jgi:hypothetical protein
MYEFGDGHHKLVPCAEMSALHEVNLESDFLTCSSRVRPACKIRALELS